MKIKDLIAWFLDQWPVKILSLSIAVLLYFFTNLVNMESESLTLPVQYILPNAMVQAQEYPQTVKLHIRGSSKSLEQVRAEDLQVVVDFSYAHEEGSYQSPVRIRPTGIKGGIDTFDIEIEPQIIQTRLERVEYKEVPVKVVFDGEPRNGHEILNYSVVPSRVKISGPRSFMKNLDVVETDAVELDSRTSSFTQRIHLRRPSQLVNVSNIETVEIRVDIREMNLPMVFSALDVIPENLPAGLLAELAVQRVRVQVEATSSVLQELADDRIKARLDLAALGGPGDYELPVEVILPEGVVLTELEPKTIKVKVSADSSQAASSELPPLGGVNEELR